MKIIRLILTCLLFHIYMPSVAQTTFQKAYSYFHNDYANSIQKTNDGGYIVTGPIYIHSTTYRNDFYLFKIDSIGVPVWSRTIGDLIYEENTKSARQTSDSGYIICGERYQAGGPVTKDIFIVKTNNTGNVQWTKSYDRGNLESGVDAQQTNDGGYIVLGLIEYPVPHICLIKTNAVGDTTWTKILNSGLNASDVGNSIEQTSDGGYIITGGRYISPNTQFITLIKTDSTGNTVWGKSYSGLHQANAVQQTTDGGFIIAGSTYTTQYHVLLIKTDALGDTLWTKRFGGTFTENGYSVRQTNDGGYIVAGDTRSFGAGLSDAYLIRTDSTGNPEWSKAYGGAGTDPVFSVQQANDGGFIAAGETVSFIPGQVNFYIIKTDSVGNSGCNEMNAATIVTAPVMTVAALTMIQMPSGLVVSSPVVLEDTGITVTTLCFTTGIENAMAGNSMHIYPNPSAGDINISMIDFIDDGAVEIISPDGKIIFRKKISNESEIKLRVKNIYSGLYFVKIRDGKKMFVQKVIIQ